MDSATGLTNVADQVIPGWNTQRYGCTTLITEFHAGSLLLQMDGKMLLAL
jgi:hypothetical protein